MSLRCRLGIHRWSSWGLLSKDRHCVRCGKTEKTLSDFLQPEHNDGVLMPEYVPPVDDEPGVWIFWPSTHCIDYGHHGRERCVVCGLPRGVSHDQDAPPTMDVEVHYRSLPDQLRYHADAILNATERYARSEVTSHALALKLLADEIEQVDDQVVRWETRVQELRETWPGREVAP